MTSTRAKGEGNGNFYHIEVIDLPFHRITFRLVVLYHSSTMRKNYILLKNYTQNCDDLRGLNFAGQSIFN